MSLNRNEIQFWNYFKFYYRNSKRERKIESNENIKEKGGTFNCNKSNSSNTLNFSTPESERLNTWNRSERLNKRMHPFLEL